MRVSGEKSHLSRCNVDYERGQRGESDQPVNCRWALSSCQVGVHRQCPSEAEEDHDGCQAWEEVSLLDSADQTWHINEGRSPRSWMEECEFHRPILVTPQHQKSCPKTPPARSKAARQNSISLIGGQKMPTQNGAAKGQKDTAHPKVHDRSTHHRLGVGPWSRARQTLQCISGSRPSSAQ